MIGQPYKLEEKGPGQAFMGPATGDPNRRIGTKDDSVYLRASKKRKKLKLPKELLQRAKHVETYERLTGINARPDQYQSEGEGGPGKRMVEPTRSYVNAALKRHEGEKVGKFTVGQSVRYAEHDWKVLEQNNKGYALVCPQGKHIVMGVKGAAITTEDMNEAKQRTFIRKADLAKLPDMGAQENEQDPMVYVKFFNPYGVGTWLATEYDGRDRFFGAVNLGHGWELGYFSRRELQSLKKFGVPQIERDQYFKPQKLSAAKHA